MKSYSAAAAGHLPAKRRWNCFTIAVPIIVFLSLIGTVSVLLGLHSRFPPGHSSEENPNLGNRFANDEKLIKNDEKRVDELVDKFKPTFPKEGSGDNRSAPNFISDSAPIITTSPPKPGDMNLKGLPKSHFVPSETASSSNSKDEQEAGKNNIAKGSAADANVKSCQLEFGSYCLWSKEHKQVMKDSLVKRLKDQVFLARAYYPTIAKLKGQEKFARQMKQNIQDHEKMLSDAISDPDLPSFVQMKIEKMDQTIAKAKSYPADCHNVDKKLAQILYLTEDEAHFHMKQSAFLYHLGVQTIPKSHHCLIMRLTVEYFKAPPADIEQLHAHKLDNPEFQQYVIFSQSVLSTSVTINSTVLSSQETRNMVFNIITDAQNFYAMKLWFSMNSYEGAFVHVVNAEELNLNDFYGKGLVKPSPLEEFRVSIHDVNQQTPSQTRTEYLSLFGHSVFLIPEIFKNSKKVVVLADDVVVQKDISALWDIDLHGKVNGAVEFCGVKLGQIKSYLGNSYTADSCAWMSGLNVLDLEKWREVNITGKYQQSLRKFYNGSETSWRTSTLPASLLTFQDQIHHLDQSWLLSGLGYNYATDVDTVKNAKVLHYNGNMKPWLDIGIPKFRIYWKKFLAQGNQFMDQCNVNH